MLFLGAGVSVPSGLPTAEQLSRKIFRGSYHEADDRHFYPGRRPASTIVQDSTPRVRSLLRLLRRHDRNDILRVGLYSTKSGFASSGAIFRGASTYEDLYFLCQEISQWSIGLADHSMTTPFMEFIARRAGKLLNGRTVKARLHDLGLLADSASVYIESVVAHALRAVRPVGFELVLELIESPDITGLTIATLNHDTLMEDLLRDRGVELTDGFGVPDGGVRWYDETLFDVPGARVKLLKLHGSIDWNAFPTAAGLRRAAILNDPRRTLADHRGQQLSPAYRSPSFLSGINKSVSYQRGIFADVHYRFHQAMRQSNIILMSGYGWGDLAINHQLDTWLERSKRNTIVLLHRNPEELVNRSIVLQSSYENRVASGQIIPIRKWMSETARTDLPRGLLT
jgi:hypothetical protein